MQPASFVQMQIGPYFDSFICFPVYTGSRVPIYEFIRRDVFHLPPAAHFTVKRKTDNENNSNTSVSSSNECEAGERDWRFVLRAATAGMVAGGTAQFLASPTDLMKVRLQTEHAWQSEASFTTKSGLTRLDPHAQISSGGIVRIFKQLLSEGGVTGLWRGGLPNVQRAALINMGELTTYDTAKRWYAIRFQWSMRKMKFIGQMFPPCPVQDGPFLHICSSATSGFVAAVVGTPADMIKTRIMNQRASYTDGLMYNGVIDCATKVVRNEGCFALYKGFFLIWARIAPWSLTFWLTYEKIRVLIGVGGF
ncbi:Mitochondrial uncoupling protein 4 [Fasciola gigantica]|uniref:Mitochondrial uncoupling protein 4 n=1 Tax=Fasciola gigantica TaxID=46835 RepID=A0A504YA39_FASGI|nr:Mitochondrial uncoupling protein 4 [Fasciola gigantica]